MKQIMEYKNFLARIAYDDRDNIFVGKVINTNNHNISFHGKSVNELKKSFHESIEDYLDYCEKKKIEPEKPFSGKFIVRIEPEFHKKIVEVANEKNISINKFVENALLHEINTLQNH